MATIRHEINIQGESYTSSPADRISFNSDSYNGSLTYFFEAACSVSNGTGTITLQNNAGTVTYATLTFTETSTTIKRAACSTNPATGTLKTVLSKTGTTCTVSQSKLIVVQTTTGGITASESQIEMGRGTAGTTSTSLVLSTYPRYWRYDSSKWDGTVACYLEATLGITTGGTATAQLQVDDGSFANWADVTNGVVTATAYGLVRAGSAFTPINGRHYRLAYKTDNASYTAYCYNAKIVVVQTGTITKLEEQYLVDEVGQWQTGQKTRGFKWVASDWSADNVVFHYAHSANSSASAQAKLVDIDNSNADISGATATGAYCKIAAAGFTMPTDGHRVVQNVVAVQICDARVIAYVTDADQAKSATDTLLVKLTETAIATSIVLTATKDGAHIDLSWS